MHTIIFARGRNHSRPDVVQLRFTFSSESLFTLLIGNLAEHPGDRADTLMFLLVAHMTVQALILFCGAAYNWSSCCRPFARATRWSVIPSTSSTATSTICESLSWT